MAAGAIDWAAWRPIDLHVNTGRRRQKVAGVAGLLGRRGRLDSEDPGGPRNKRLQYRFNCAQHVRLRLLRVGVVAYGE